MVRKERKYVGDPLNAVRIFNEKQVDEIFIADIDATVLNKDPDYKLIEKLAEECRMPLCYGGGIKSLEQIKRIISLGVEKISLSYSAINDPDLISEASQHVGSQSIVVVIDTMKKGWSGHYIVFTHNGLKNTGLKTFDFVKNVEKLGAGEIILNSIERDGSMLGYDFELIDAVMKYINIPITVLGGAGSREDITRLMKRYGIVGAAAGSLFVFKGRYRAVLINYPNTKEKKELLDFTSDIKRPDENFL